MNRTQEFINGILPYAVLVQLFTAIPASLIIAQAILESNSGRSELAKKENNLFGIKGEGRTFVTAEFSPDQGWGEKEDEFRTYGSDLGSFIDHASLLSRRYSEVKGLDPMEGAKVLQSKGYATDPNYAGKLQTLINAYELERYDKWARIIRVIGLLGLLVVGYLLIKKIRENGK